MILGKSHRSVAPSASLLLTLLLLMAFSYQAFAAGFNTDGYPVTIGLSASTSASVDSVKRGDVMYVKFELDHMCTSGDSVVNISDIMRSSSASGIIVRSYANDNCTGDSTTTYATSYSLDPAAEGDSVATFSFTVPNISSNRKSFQIAFRVSVYDATADLEYVAPNANAKYSYRASGTTTSPSTAWGTIYTNKYMKLYSPSAAPTLTYPSASFQSGHDNNTMKVKFTIPATPASNSVVLNFISGSTIRQKITFTGISASGTYKGILNYDASNNGGLGGFDATSDDPDETGTTLNGITIQDTLTSGQALLSDGSTYTVQLVYNEADKNPATASYTSFVYDVTTNTAVTMNEPGGSNTHANNSIYVSYTLPEAALDGSVYLTFRDSDGSLIDSLVMTDETAGTHTGTFTYTPSSSPKFSTSSSGSAGVAIASQTNNGGAIMSDQDDIYVTISYQDVVGNSTVREAAHHFLYDLSTSPAVWSAPANLSNVTVNATPVAFSWNNPEGYTSLQLQFIWASGTADGNSPHTFIFTGANSAQYKSAGNKSINLTPNALSATLFQWTYNNANGTPLVAGATYTIRLVANDLLNSGSQNSDRTIYAIDGVTTAPTMNEPGTTNTRSNNSIFLSYDLAETALNNSVKIQFRSSDGSTLVHELVMTDETAGTHSGTLTYNPSGSPRFSTTSSGATGVAIATNSTTGAMVNGTTYMVRVIYQDASGAPTAQDDNTFVYDTGTQAATWVSPADLSVVTIDGTPDSLHFVWNNAEDYSSLVLSLIRTAGDADPNSPHVLTLVSGFRATGNNIDLGLNLANLHDNGDYTYNGADGTPLVANATYTFRLTANDLVGNGTVDRNRSFTTIDGVTSIPTLTTPSDDSRDNTSLAVAYDLPEHAYSATVKLGFFTRNTNTPVQTWTMVSEEQGSHSGTVTMVSGLPTTGGGTDLDYGVTVESYTGSALVSGTSYDIKLWYQDIGGSPVSDTTSATPKSNNFTYDTGTTAPSITTPTNNGVSNATTVTFTYTQPEAALSGSKKVTFTRASGTADGTSPHTFTFNDANLAGGGTETFNGGNLALAGHGTWTSGNLVSGTYYNISFTYQDYLGNTAATATEVTNYLYSNTTNNVTVTGAAVGGDFARNQTNHVFYRLTLNVPVSQTNTLQSVIFAITGNSLQSDFITNPFKLFYSTFADCTSFLSGTPIGTAAYGSTVTFSSMSQSLVAGNNYIYLTGSTSNTAYYTRYISAYVDEAVDIAFATGSAVGSFPTASANSNLPVELATFSGASRNGVAYLMWTTETERNSAGFEMLRAASGSETFESVGIYSNVDALRSQSENGNSVTHLDYVFEDHTVTPGASYTYRLRSYDLDGFTRNIPMVAEVTVDQLPVEFALQSNYPNPFNNSTNFRFALPTTSKMTLTIYDINGREVVKVIDREMPAGVHTVLWNGRNATGGMLSSGTYIVRMNAGSFNATRKVVLLK